jgi:transglycosylase-like protein with SLT domain
MKKLCVWALVMVMSPVSSLWANSVTDTKGLGKDREHLTPELIALRSDLLETNLNFYLLRFPAAVQAPSRIFEPKLWATIERAAQANGLDPMLLAGMIFIESYGDPLAKSPTGPAGIAQMTKASAQEMGLATDRRIQVGSRTVTKTRSVGKGKNRHKVVETKEEPTFQKVDERYDPELAVMAMARRIANRRAWLGGKLDFAVAEYHMGAGRIAKLLSAYFGRHIKVEQMAAAMRDTRLSYPELFWSNTPYYRPEVYKQIEALNRVDFSPTYYFRVQQAMRLLALYKQSRAEYATLTNNFQGGFGRTVLPDWQWSFVGEKQAMQLALQNSHDLDAALGQRIVNLPAVASKFGIRVQQKGKDEKYLVAERSTIGCLLFVAHELERLEGKQFKGVQTNSLVKLVNDADSRDDAKKSLSADAELPMHSLGWAFDLTRKGLSKDQVRDLNFILTDLRYAGLLAVTDEGKQAAFHVVRNPTEANRFEQFYWDALAMPQTASVAANQP